MTPASLSSTEYVERLEEQVVQLRIQEGRLEERLKLPDPQVHELDKKIVALQTENDAKDRALSVYDKNMEKWQLEHNNMKAEYEKQKLATVTSDTFATFVQQMTKDRTTDAEKAEERAKGFDKKFAEEALVRERRVGAAQAYAKVWGIAVVVISIIVTLAPYAAKLLQSIATK